MEYMENKMQSEMERGEAMANALFTEMSLFGEWILAAIPDFDETLLENTINTFHFENEAVELMWLGWKAKSGL